MTGFRISAGQLEALRIVGRRIARLDCAGRSRVASHSRGRVSISLGAILTFRQTGVA